MLFAFVSSKNYQAYCLYLILSSIIDAGLMEASFDCTYMDLPVYKEDVKITSPSYPNTYPPNCDFMLILMAFMDSEVLVNFDHFDLAPNDVLKVYYGASPTGYATPDKTCTGNSCDQLRAFQITMRFQSGNVTTNGTYGFSATAQSIPRDYTLVASVLIILFLFAVSVPSCVFVWRNKYYKRITRRLNRHHESTNSPVFYSHESSNIIFPPPPSYEVANSMYPVCTIEDDPPPAYEVEQPDRHSRSAHSQTIESTNSAPP